MKPGPSSVRLFSKYPQSMMSRASSVTPCSSKAGCLRPWSHGRNTSPQRVNFALSTAIERVGAAAEVQSQRDRAELEVAAQRVDQIAAIALRKLVGAVAEHDEGRRPAAHLGDVAELDLPAFGRGRRIG